MHLPTPQSPQIFHLSPNHPTEHNHRIADNYPIVQNHLTADGSPLHSVSCVAEKHRVIRLPGSGSLPGLGRLFQPLNRSFRLSAGLGAHKRLITLLWFTLPFLAGLKEVWINDINNYKIFKYTFVNLTHLHSLYTLQPAYFFDSNHYGPLFALLMAPFTLVDDSVGCMAWVMLNAFILYKAVGLLPITENQRLGVLILSAHELMTSSFSVQFNPIMTAMILFSFTMVERKQEFWAAFFIVAGTLIKLYGIVGLVFFLFSTNKRTFALSGLAWTVYLFLLPMLFSSSGFIISTYHQWVDCLIDKNQLNIHSGMQDISVMGMIRRIFNFPQLSNLLVIGAGLVLFFLPFLAGRPQEQMPEFRIKVLASALMFTVLFSTGSESPTYIIAVTGMAIWFVAKNYAPRPVDITLLVFALIITSFSPSDVFPQYINEHFIRRYSLKALPILLIWLRLIVEAVQPYIIRIKGNGGGGSRVKVSTEQTYGQAAYDGAAYVQKAFQHEGAQFSTSGSDAHDYTSYRYKDYCDEDNGYRVNAPRPHPEIFGRSASVQQLSGSQKIPEKYPRLETPETYPPLAEIDN